MVQSLGVKGCEALSCSFCSVATKWTADDSLHGAEARVVPDSLVMFLLQCCDKVDS